MIAELAEADEEHGSVSLERGDWCLAFGKDRVLVFEDVESEEAAPRHMSGLSPGRVVELWKKLAAGDLASLEKEPWKPGYAAPKASASSVRFTSEPYVLLPLYAPDRALPPGAKLLSMRAANPRLSELFKQTFQGVKRANPERRSRLSFLVARSQRIVVGKDLPALADALEGLVVEEDAIHDADGRLVLDRDGGFDPRAFAPRSLLVFGALGEPQSSRGLPATRLGRAARTFFELPMRLHPDVKERLTRLQKIVTGEGPVIELTGDGPLDVDAVLRRVRAARGVVFDGWAYYDGTGRALLTHDRKLDPAARLP